MENQGGESILPGNSVIPVALVAAAAPAPPRRATVSALSPGRYKIAFTADAETYQALRQLQELMRHQVPNGDPAKIVKQALLLLLDQVRAGKTGQAKRLRKRQADVGDLWVGKEAGAAGAGVNADAGEATAMADGPRVDGPKGTASANETQPPARKPGGQASRHIPAAVKRSVWERDNGQCTFVGRNGKRCTSTGWLEYHHVHAYAMGGPATIDNIALRCRAHNAYESRQLFGAKGKKVTRSGACSGSAEERRLRSGTSPGATSGTQSGR